MSTSVRLNHISTAIQDSPASLVMIPLGQPQLYLSSGENPRVQGWQVMTPVDGLRTTIFGRGQVQVGPSFATKPFLHSVIFWGDEHAIALTSMMPQEPQLDGPVEKPLICIGFVMKKVLCCLRGLPWAPL
jgi:hypothetical protein